MSELRILHDRAEAGMYYLGVALSLALVAVGLFMIARSFREL